MADKDDINVIQTLMSIKEDVATIKTKVEDLQSADKKADKALSRSIENEHKISSLTKNVYAIYGTVFGTIGISLFIYIVEKLF